MVANSQTITWDFMEGPTTERTFSAIRRSRPMEAQGWIIRPDAKTRTMLSLEYCEMMSAMGTMFKNALAIAGISAVIVICTGRVIHQKIIQSETPIAWAPTVPKIPDNVAIERTNRRGPARIIANRFLFMAYSPHPPLFVHASHILLSL